MKEVAVLEPKPGVEPSVSHLQQVLASLKAQPARMVMYAAYQDGRRRSGCRRTPASQQCGCRSRWAATTERRICSALFDDTVERLLAGAAPKP